MPLIPLFLPPPDPIDTPTSRIISISEPDRNIEVQEDNRVIPVTEA